MFNPEMIAATAIAALITALNLFLLSQTFGLF